MSAFELSIITPVLNEAAELEDFIATLQTQRGVAFELLLCDGGSSDATVAHARRLAETAPFPIRIVPGERGRAPQMNTGAAAAASDMLLFLHVDSRFDDPLALQQGLQQLRDALQTGADVVAGRFRLTFRRSDDAHPALYYHLECKARLDRDECTHGDQGFMLPRRLFVTLGGYDECCPLAEDTDLADRLRARGTWLLFSVPLSTSARRFEVEGLVERQTFNSLLMNFKAIGWNDFFASAAEVYRSQDRAQRLDLDQWYDIILQQLRALPWRRRWQIWRATGGYVRRNAWQIPFYFDTRSQHLAGFAPGDGPNRRLAFHDRWVEPLIDHPPGRLAATLLTWCWFHSSRLRLKLRLKSKP